VRVAAALVLLWLVAAPGLSWAGEPGVGDPAPDFALPGSDGKIHRLSELRGQRAVVLAWFPKAFTPGCTLECKSLARNGDRIRRFQVAYFMASVDAPEQSRGFASAHRADFPLLSDPSKQTARAYGVLGPSGLARRWTFYIGRDGRILAIDKQVDPATSAEDIAATLDRLGVARRATAP
jgi:peroxiredoxin Q/BCP